MKLNSQIFYLMLVIVAGMLLGCSDVSEDDSTSGDNSGISVSINDDETSTTETATGAGMTGSKPVEIANDGKANLTMSITDAPIDDASSVKVTFSRIEIKQGACAEVSDTCDSTGDACGYTEFFKAFEESEEITIDLLTYRNGNSFFFDTQSLDVGEYCQIRIFLSDSEAKNTITLTGETEAKNLNINSGIQNNGLKLVSGFTITDGVETKLTLDFDVRKSIVVKGGSKNPKYHLKPTIRLQQTNLSGNITITKDVTAADEIFYLYTQDFDVSNEANTQVIDDHGTTDTSDDTLVDMPYANATSSAVSYEINGTFEAVFTFIPFGTYDIYSYDISADGLNLVEEDIVLAHSQ